LFTALFGISIMLIANQAFFLSNVRISDAQAVPKMAEMLGAILGPFGTYAYSIGFWAGGVRVAAGRLAERPVYLRRLLQASSKKDPEHVRQESIKVPASATGWRCSSSPSRRCRSRSFGGPLFIIVTYTIVGSLFIPFLAATLLYLNNRVKWTAPVPHNRWATNALLLLILALFVGVGVQEIINAL
jgi:hypothetical protein